MENVLVIPIFITHKNVVR